MTMPPEFVEIDDESFYNGTVLIAAGLDADFFDEARMTAYLEAGIAVQGVDDANLELLQYPSEEGGVAMLLRFQGDAYDLINAWPFLPVVVNSEIVPLKAAVAPAGTQAFVTGRVGSAVLTWFDDGFIENAPDYRAGKVAYGQFYGLAAQLSEAESTVFQIGPGDEEFEQLVAAGQKLNEDGVITISMAGAAMCVPRPDIALNAFEFRGPVMAGELLARWITPDAAVVHVTILRPYEDEDGTALEEGFDLPILVHPNIIDGGALPRPGDEVQGIVFLYGTGFEGDPIAGDDTPLPN